MPKIPISNGYFAALFKSPNLINEFRKNSQGMTSDTWNLKYPQIETSLDKGTQRKTTENELPSLTQCTA